jgi:hypothetical protein
MIPNKISYDYEQTNGLKVVMQQLSEANEIELVEQIYALSDRPEVLGLLIYKLMQERKKTNDLLEELNTKYDSLIKTQGFASIKNTNLNLEGETSIDNLFVTEQDKSILLEAKNSSYIDAKAIQDKLGYKGLNAASQRLNKLNKEGYLDKKRVGQKVVFILSNKYSEIDISNFK